MLQESFLILSLDKGDPILLINSNLTVEELFEENKHEGQVQALGFTFDRTLNPIHFFVS